MGNLANKLFAYKTVIYWMLTRNLINFDYKVKGVNSPKFMTAREAAKHIPDEAVIAGCGMVSNMRPATCFLLVRDSFERTGHPANITWISPGGAGTRGKAPGAAEEICIKGLLKWFISGHHETVRAALAMADRGDLTLTVFPQGTVCHLVEAQANGEDSVLTEVGVGTFMDPRVGTGTQVEPGKGPQLVEVEGDKLRYRLPKVNVSALLATYADADGNIYMKDAPMYTEVKEVARAVRRNNGFVMITVSRIIPKDEANIFLRADEVDAIVVNPRNEQTTMFRQSKPIMEITLGQNAEVAPFLAKLNALNKLTKFDTLRKPIDYALARQAAKIFARVGFPGANTIIGYGLPQEMGAMINSGGLGKDITFLIETGVMGGLPSPGFFFGTAINPKKLISSAEMFHYIEKNLDVTCLGTLQVDAGGNVNVSRKSNKVTEYVGPGGFINLVTYSKNIIFVGQWMTKAEMSIVDGKLVITKRGTPKFVKHVEEITFSAKSALKDGLKVFYCTNVGTFRLTERGLELFQVAPGVDIQKDIIDFAPDARIVLPLDGKIEVLDRSVMTGEGFSLSWDK